MSDSKGSTLNLMNPPQQAPDSMIRERRQSHQLRHNRENRMNSIEENRTSSTHHRKRKSLYSDIGKDMKRQHQLQLSLSTRFTLGIGISPNGVLRDPEGNTALHHAIRNGAVSNALEMIPNDSIPLDLPNAKDITPLAMASQRGFLNIVQALLNAGANPNLASVTGQTPLIQAAHQGHFEIAELLIRKGAIVEHANLNSTTALMRAAQEGHAKIVRLLLKCRANVNKKNDESLTSLMLAAQRGHATVVELLIQSGAEINAMSGHGSTSLMLACKRGNYQVVQVLVANGAEIFLKDLKLRTARIHAKSKDNKALLRLLCPTLQVAYMKHRAMREIKLIFAKYYELLQRNRATVNISPTESRLIQFITPQDLSQSNLLSWQQSLVQVMCLPTDIVEHIVTYLPKPDLWQERLNMLETRFNLDADSAAFSAFDLIDEVLVDSGFLTAFSKINIPPPSPFASWTEWESWGIKCDKSPDLYQPSSVFDHSYYMLFSDDESEAASSVDAVVAPPARVQARGQPFSDLNDAFYDYNIVIPSRRRARGQIVYAPADYPLLTNVRTDHFTLDLRRKANILKSVVAENNRNNNKQFKQLPWGHYSPFCSNKTTLEQQENLKALLTKSPFSMSETLYELLIKCADVQVSARKLSKNVHLDRKDSLTAVRLARALVQWYENRRQKF